MSYCIDELSMAKIFVASSRHNFYAPIERFYCLSLKGIEFNGIDTIGFLRNLVVSIFFFKVIDTLKSY